MESLEKELGVLLAEQMREQMNNLSAAVQLLTDELGDRDEKCRQYLAIMNQSMYRMMRMVSNLEYVNAMGGAREFRDGRWTWPVCAGIWSTRPSLCCAGERYPLPTGKSGRT